VYFDGESNRFVVSLTDNAGWTIAAIATIVADNFIFCFSNFYVEIYFMGFSNLYFDELRGFDDRVMVIERHM